MFKHNPVN